MCEDACEADGAGTIAGLAKCQGGGGVGREVAPSTCFSFPGQEWDGKSWLDLDSSPYFQTQVEAQHRLHRLSHCSGMLFFTPEPPLLYVRCLVRVLTVSARKGAVILEVCLCE